MASSDPTVAILGCSDLVKIYHDGDVHALRGVNIAVEEKTSVAITGQSGSGKSTLLHLLGGLDRPTSGDVSFRGQSLKSLNIDAFRALKVGFIFQSFHLIPTLSALENVQIPMFETARPRSERSKRAAGLLGEVGLSHRGRHLPSRLSVGERQRVAIARALANEPDLILADEPTGNLDSQTQNDILTLLSQIRRDRGLTVVMVTHSVEVAASCDREIKIRDGLVCH